MTTAENYPVHGALRAWLWALVALLMSVPMSAAAYDPEGLRVGVGSGSLFGVEPVNARGHLEVTTGLWIHAAGATLRKASMEGDVDLAGTSVRGAVTAGLSLFGRGRLGFVLPVVFSQTGETLGGAPIDGSGLADPRVIGHVALEPNAGKGLGVGATLEMTLPLGDQESWTGDGAAGVVGYLEAEYLTGPLSAVGRVGYRIRTAQRVFDLAVGDAIEAAVGFRFESSPRVQIEGLLSAATLASSPFAGGATPLELMVGVRHAFHRCYGVTVGGGGPVHGGVGAAAWRALVGISHACADGPSRREAARQVRVTAAARKAAVDETGDADGDGIPDGRDWCPTEAEDRDQHQDEDGCPEPDNDGDGVEDTEDACPSIAEDLDRYEDADGCPDEDNDGDGIPDLRDRCPDAAETADGVDDDDGCPEAPDESTVRVVAGYLMPSAKIAHAPGDGGLTTGSQKVLAEVTRYLIRRPAIRLVEVEGHTHSQGDDGQNLQRSAERARGVMARLVELGVASGRLRAKGFGETMPLESNATKEGRAANERIDLRIVKAPAEGKPNE